MMLVEKRFNTGEVELNYAEGPDNGPPLVLLHGFTSRWQFYLPVIPYLESRYHIYAPDLRGHGRSGHTPGKYNYDYDYQDLQSFLENIVPSGVILVGHSRGGVQAAMLASRNPEHVKAAVFLDPPLFMTEASKRNMGWWKAYNTITMMDGSFEEKVDAFKNLEVEMGDSSFLVSDMMDELGIIDRVSCLCSMDPSVLEVKIKSMLDEEAAKEYQGWYETVKVLSMIKCPVLIVQSEESVALPDKDLKQVRELLDNAFSLRLSGYGHSLGIEEWNIGDLMRAMTPFLESYR